MTRFIRLEVFDSEGSVFTDYGKRIVYINPAHIVKLVKCEKGREGAEQEFCAIVMEGNDWLYCEKTGDEIAALATDTPQWNFPPHVPSHELDIEPLNTSPTVYCASSLY